MALSTDVYTYDPKEVDLIIGGIEIKQYGSDSMISVNPNNDRAEIQEGINGSISVNINRKLAGTLEVTVPAGSRADEFFTELQLLKKAYPIVLSVPSKNIQLIARAWYQSQPPAVIGSQVDDNTYVLGINNSSFSLIDNLNSAIGAVETVFN